MTFDLRRHLIRQGLIDGRGIGPTPKPWRCTSCGLYGLAAWGDGILDPVLVDPVALTPLGELQAQLAGRITYEHWGGTSGGLSTRHAAAITRGPAGSDLLTPVRPEHRCGSPPLDTVPDPPTAVTPADGPPPF